MKEMIQQDPQKSSASQGLKPLFIFCLLVFAGILVSTLTPLREMLTVKNIELFATRIGWWGPLFLFLYGLFGPLLFLPRWPVCFLGGMLYGIGFGALIANVATTSGAFLHYLSARWLVAPSSVNALKKLKINPEKLTPLKSFWLIFLLRAFPLSNSAATNILAGVLRMKKSSYLLSSFIGMIPSTIMYAAWGKLLKKPEPQFYYTAVGLLVVLSIGTLLVRKRLFKSSEA